MLVFPLTANVQGADDDWPRVYDATSTYRDIPDGQFLEIFADMEASCRKVLSRQDERLVELRERFTDEQARTLHETVFLQCMGAVGSRMSVARLYGYKMRAKDSLDPAFWSRLDDARANFK